MAAAMTLESGRNTKTRTSNAMVRRLARAKRSPRSAPRRASTSAARSTRTKVSSALNASTSVSARQRVDLLVPLVEQAPALGRGAVLLEVVFDQLDVTELGRFLRNLGAAIGRRLELLASRPQRRSGRGERPVLELLGALEVARAVDHAERADLVAGALARRDPGDRKARHHLGDHVVHEAHADQRLAARYRLDRSHPRLRVLVDVRVQLLEVLEPLGLAHQLDDRRDRRVRGPRRGGIRNLHFAFQCWLEQVGPAAGRGQVLLLEQFGVVAEAERAHVDADRAIAGLLGLSHGPRV